MKIIHTGDIHLDSNDLRKQDLVDSFLYVVEYSNQNNINTVLVAGDLFDSDYVSQQTFSTLCDIFAKFSHIHFYILRGNHGGKSSYTKLENLQFKNLHFFSQDRFTIYKVGNIAIAGTELTGNDSNKYGEFTFPEDTTHNIVMLHGEIDSDIYGEIDIKSLSNAGANYIALGHRHSFEVRKFGKTKVVYCGVLETRGFDENAKTGFVVYDTDTTEVNFVPHYIKKVENITVDVTKVTSNYLLTEKTIEQTNSVGIGNYLNLTFEGTLEQGVSLNFVQSQIATRFFALRVTDKTTANIDIEKIKQEVSLRAEFVKLTDSLDDEIKQQVLKLGLAALSGEVEK